MAGQVTLETLRDILAEALQVEADRLPAEPGTALLGEVAELDSMGVVAVLTGIEQHLGITIPDDAIDAEAFATLGELQRFVERLS